MIKAGDIVEVDTMVDGIGEQRAEVLFVSSYGPFTVSVKFLHGKMGITHEFAFDRVRKLSLLELLIETEPPK